MLKFRKKPVVIEAVQWNKPVDGRPLYSYECTDHPAVHPTGYSEIADLCGTSGCSKEFPYWDWSVMGIIDTMEGKHVVRPGDWIITGDQGEVYPCKPDIFEQTYEPLETE